MTHKTAGAYLNLLIGKDLDVHHTGNQSGNITVHARGWHSPSWFAKELGSLRAEPDGVLGRASRGCSPGRLGAAWPWGLLEPSTWSPLPLHARSPPRLEERGRVTKGWLSHGNDITTKTDTSWSYFFSPKPFISRQCSGANWTWLCAKSELRLNQFRQR